MRHQIVYVAFDFNRRLKYLRAVGGFRTSFYYSNLMYGLVTYIGEVLGGTSWEELIKSKLYDPLGMTSSTFTTIADPEQIDLAKGYIDIDGDLMPVPFELSKYVHPVGQDKGFDV